MRYIYLLVFCVMAVSDVFAFRDTTIVIPLQRRLWHDKIKTEQKLCDRADGKVDNQLRVGKNESINLHVTDALFRRVKQLQDWVEINPTIKNNNEKIRYLTYIENMLKDQLAFPRDKPGCFS
jgi:hypothetical protein